MSHFFEILPDGAVQEFVPDDGFQARLVNFERGLKYNTDAKGRRRSDSHQNSMERLDAFCASALDGYDRADAFAPGMGMFNPQDLTYRFKQAMEERLPPLSADRLFPVNTEVDPGAASYEQRRLVTTGRAVTYAGGMGDDVPEVDIGQTSFNQPLTWFVSRFAVDFREGLSGRFAGLDTVGRKVAAIRRVMYERRNALAWRGDNSIGMRGIIGHDYIDAAVSQVPYNDDSAIADIISDFSHWAQWATEESLGAYSADAVVFGQRLYNYLSRTFLNLGNASNITIMAALKLAHPQIKSWEWAAELNDTLESGVHGIQFYAKGSGGKYDHSLELVDAMAPTLLAPEKRALGQQTFMIGCFGGANHTSAGDNLTVHVTGP